MHNSPGLRSKNVISDMTSSWKLIKYPDMITSGFKGNKAKGVSNVT